MPPQGDGEGGGPGPGCASGLLGQRGSGRSCRGRRGARREGVGSAGRAWEAPCSGRELPARPAAAQLAAPAPGALRRCGSPARGTLPPPVMLPQGARAVGPPPSPPEAFARIDPPRALRTLAALPPPPVVKAPGSPPGPSEAPRSPLPVCCRGPRSSEPLGRLLRHPGLLQSSRLPLGSKPGHGFKWKPTHWWGAREARGPPAKA